MSRFLLGCAGVLVAALAAAGCSNSAYRSYDEREVLDAAEAQPLATDGTFAEIGSDDQWLFEPADPALALTSLSVGERTRFFAAGQPVDRDAIEEGMPVRVTWDPQLGEILRVDVVGALGGEPGQREASPPGP